VTVFFIAICAIFSAILINLAGKRWTSPPGPSEEEPEI
jgi:hypothetical protein